MARRSRRLGGATSELPGDELGPIADGPAAAGGQQETAALLLSLATSPLQTVGDVGSPIAGDVGDGSPIAAQQAAPDVSVTVASKKRKRPGHTPALESCCCGADWCLELRRSMPSDYNFSRVSLPGGVKYSSFVDRRIAMLDALPDIPAPCGNDDCACAPVRSQPSPSATCTACAARADASLFS
jgi:hypothetical protein